MRKNNIEEFCFKQICFKQITKNKNKLFFTTIDNNDEMFDKNLKIVAQRSL